MQNQNICLFFFFFVSTAFLILYRWIVFYFLCFVVLICVIIYLLFQTYHIVEDLNKRHGASNTAQRVNFEKSKTEKYRKSTYKPYGKGWYPLCWSNEVKKGEAIQCNALGKEFAIFRGAINGEVGVLGAYCPHLGANLVVGGKVCGDSLQCPFHLWKFDKNGICKDIPYLKTKKNGEKKIPTNANAKCYPSIEYHGMVCVYYGGDIPSYNLPIQKDLLTKDYSFVNKLDYGLVNMNIQEFAENAADWMHFEPIHGRMMFPFSQMEIPIISRWLSISHKPATHVGGGSSADSIEINKKGYGPDDKHFLYFITQSHLKWCGESIPKSDGKAQITFCGPAGITIFRLNIPSYDPSADIIIFHTHLPEDKMNLRVRFHWYASNKLPRLLVWYVVGNWISQWKNDIEIWENKIFLDKPCLVKGDGPLLKVRRWWKQFYPDKYLEQQKKERIIVNGDDEKKEKEKDVESIVVQGKSDNMDW